MSENKINVSELNFPTKSDVLIVLQKHSTLSIKELHYHLAISKDEAKKFKKLLKSMSNLINISKDNLVSLKKHSIHEGIYQSVKEFNFVVDSVTDEKIYIKNDIANYALVGDVVKVRVIGANANGDLLGEIIEVKKRKLKNVAGKIEQYKDVFYLNSQNAQLGKFPVVVSNINKIEKIDVTKIQNAEICHYPNDEKPYFMADLIKTENTANDDEAFINAQLFEANIALEFPKKVLANAHKYAETVQKKDLKGREDLRDLPFVTIDGADAKDFDDAVYASKNADGTYRLSVAIADVAHYVTHESAIDKEAFARGTSIYFPRRVIPMLPEVLSNGLCSLNPHVDRLVMVCHMDINENGEVVNYSVANAVIYSHARLTYDKVEEFLTKKAKAEEDIADNINNLHNVYKVLFKARQKRGAIDFHGSEAYFDFDEAGKVNSLKPRNRLVAHRLIEECMLAANITIADFLIQHKHPTLFRNHAKPNEKKFGVLKSILNGLAIKFDVDLENVTSLDYAKLIKYIQKLPNSMILEQIILRSMQMAEYSPENIGHFGLAFDKYLHFTSPIRRYPDLLVHRACKAVLEGTQYKYALSIDKMGEQCCVTERKAEELSRKVDTYYKCVYAREHIGNTYSGIVTSIINFGMFVYLPELLIDGMVHVTRLDGDYYVFDDTKHTLTGKTNGFQYTMGQVLDVAIAAVNMQGLFIDLELVKKEG